MPVPCPSVHSYGFQTVICDIWREEECITKRKHVLDFITCMHTVLQVSVLNFCRDTLHTVFKKIKSLFWAKKNKKKQPKTKKSKPEKLKHMNLLCSTVLN